MPAEPLVSIIINNYNYARFLGAAIDSALGQTYPHVEVIVVDDGSTDASPNVIRAYGDRVQPVFKANGGQASALNAGFAESQGDIVIFLDADDVLLADTVARVVEVFCYHPDVVKVQYCFEVIDKSGHRTGRRLPSPHLPLPNGDVRAKAMRFPADIAWMSTSGNAFAAWVLRCLLPMPEAEFRILADYYLNHLTPLFGPVISLDRVGALYRIHGSNQYSSLDFSLAMIRSTVQHWTTTAALIPGMAAQLGLPDAPRGPDDVLSVAHLIVRAISVKLDPAQHPIPGDSPARLLRLGVVAARRRFDVTWPMKLAYVFWFVAMTLAPRRVAQWLAEQAMEPGRRCRVNTVLAAFNTVPRACPQHAQERRVLEGRGQAHETQAVEGS